MYFFGYNHLLTIETLSYVNDTFQKNSKKELTKQKTPFILFKVWPTINEN